MKRRAEKNPKNILDTIIPTKSKKDWFNIDLQSLFSLLFSKVYEDLNLEVGIISIEGIIIGNEVFRRNFVRSVREQLGSSDLVSKDSGYWKVCINGIIFRCFENNSLESKDTILTLKV